MNLIPARRFSRGQRARGMTLCVLMVSVALGCLLLATTGPLWLLGSLGFVALAAMQTWTTATALRSTSGRRSSARRAACGILSTEQ